MRSQRAALETANYYNDPRVIAGMITKPKLNRSETALIYDLVDDDGDEFQIEVPCKMAVCSTCQGRGRHVNPAIDAGGLTEEDLNDHWSSEEREGYFHGAFDTTCNDCKGKRVVPVANLDALPEAERKMIIEYEEEEEASAREWARELAMGC